MWDAVRNAEQLYDQLEMKPEAVELFRLLNEKYREQVEILTGIPKPNHGIATTDEDKIRWGRRLLSEAVSIHVVYKEEKLLH